jgi:hypothetical protein
MAFNAENCSTFKFNTFLSNYTHTQHRPLKSFNLFYFAISAISLTHCLRVLCHVNKSNEEFEFFLQILIQVREETCFKSFFQLNSILITESESNTGL